MPLFNVLSPPKKTQASYMSCIISLNDPGSFYLLHRLLKPGRKLWVCVCVLAGFSICLILLLILQHAGHKYFMSAGMFENLLFVWQGKLYSLQMQSVHGKDSACATLSVCICVFPHRLLYKDGRPVSTSSRWTKREAKREAKTFRIWVPLVWDVGVIWK